MSHAAGGGIGAGEDLHQRAFSGAVLPHQGVDLALSVRQFEPGLGSDERYRQWEFKLDKALSSGPDTWILDNQRRMMVPDWASGLACAGAIQRHHRDGRRDRCASGIARPTDHR